MELWLRAERQDHLESLEDSNDPKVQQFHLTIARWIKYFISTCREFLVDADEAVRHPSPPGDPDYMDFDSDAGEPDSGAPAGEA
jgi:hypothetical protein